MLLMLFLSLFTLLQWSAWNRHSNNSLMSGRIKIWQGLRLPRLGMVLIHIEQSLNRSTGLKLGMDYSLVIICGGRK